MQNCYSFWLILFWVTCISRVCQTMNFSQAHVVVWFSPYISKYTPQNAYNQSHLMAMTAKIATKFSRIMIQHLLNTKVGADLAEFPLAVATFNKLYRGGGNQPVPRPPPLELIMLYKEQTFSVTKQIADEANSVFPNTIRTLLYFPDKLNTSTAAEVGASLARYKYLLSNNNTATTTSTIPNSYKLGVYTSMGNCGGNSQSYLPPELASVLPHIEVIFFAWFPTFASNYDYAHGAAYCADKLINLASTCKTKLLLHYSKTNPASLVEVGFRSHWPDTGIQDGVRNVTEFLLYWKLLNEFAESSNTSVVPSEAFDDFAGWERKWGYDTLGWWRLVEKDGRGVTNPAEFVFKEKAQTEAQVAPSRPSTVSIIDEERDALSLPHSNIDIPTIALVAVGATSVATFLGAALVTLFYKCMRKRAKRKAAKEKEEIKIIINNQSLELQLLGGGGQRISDPPTDTDHPPVLDTECSELVLNNSEVDTQGFVALEFDLSRVEIFEDLVLGSGDFGHVVRGNLRSASGHDVLPVAIKMCKSPTTGIALRALLAEIKVLTCVAHHENVLKILGVVRGSVEGANKLMVLTELCELGSLEKHLRSVRRMDDDDDEFRSSIPSGSSLPGESSQYYYNWSDEPSLESPYCNWDWSERSFLRDLKSWSCQIASGMEYLASKHVVHADLGTRNVLLTRSKTAKVSDFGLSRRLAEGADYYKKGDMSGGVPWRWMSPEALKQWKFNEKSDVWAFGVTLWEIYSLGEIPYHNLGWTEVETELDQNNMRLSRPKWSCLEMYAIMVTCWEPSPEDRPSFADLRLMLEEHAVQL